MAYEKYIAAVAVSNTTFGYDRRYKYLVPVDLEGRIFVGGRVIVPFGKGNRKRIGVVIRIDNVSDLPDGENVTMFKPLRSVIDNEPLLNAEMLELMMWIRETTLCTYFEAFRTLIPIGLSVNYTSKYIIAEDRPSDTGILSEEARKLWDTIQNDIQCLDEAKVSVIKELEDKGFLTEKDDVKRRRDRKSVV